MNPLIKPSDEYGFAKLNLTPAEKEVLALIEENLADGPPDYGWDNRTDYANGWSVIAMGGLLVGFRPEPDGTFFMIDVIGQNALPPWDSVE